MPLYEYLCEACGERHEALQRMDDSPLTVCPFCGGALRKLHSAPAFHFKGSGWYQSDYARKPAGGGETTKGGGDAPASVSGEGGGETKSAGDEAPAKPPAKPPTKPAGE